MRPLLFSYALKSTALSVSLCLFFSSSVHATFKDFPVHSNKWTKQYDRHFKKYSKRYFGPLFDWHWFKAQGIAESGLNSDSKSHVGASGIMQLMPRTFEEINEKNPHFKAVDTPRLNIAAGIYYDRMLYRKFKNIPEQEKLYLALASYNAGYGRILRASKKSKVEKASWDDIRPHLPGQTRAYVHRIKNLMGKSAH